MSRRIEELLPEVQPKARAFLSLIPIAYVVTSTLRTEAEQAALYAQGRAPLEAVNARRAIAGMRLISAAENKYEANMRKLALGQKLKLGVDVITMADGIIHKSNHQGGRALDVVPANASGNPIWPPGTDPRWEMIAKAGEEAGFEWGGHWDDPDRPHYEILL